MSMSVLCLFQYDRYASIKSAGLLVLLAAIVVDTVRNLLDTIKVGEGKPPRPYTRPAMTRFERISQEFIFTVSAPPGGDL